jgi:hypothetical protein
VVLRYAKDANSLDGVALSNDLSVNHGETAFRRQRVETYKD